MSAIDTSATNRLDSYTDATMIYTTTLTAALNIADTWKVAPLQAGVQVVNAQVYTSGVASSTVSLGDSNDASRFLNAVSSASAGYLNSNATVTQSSGVITKGRGYTYTANDVLTLTVAGANLSIGTVIQVIVTFKRVPF